MSVKPEQHQSRQEKVGEFEIRIESYKAGDTYYCTVNNVDPGAVLTRGQGKTREEAEQEAVESARRKVGRTRLRETDG